MLNNIVYMQGCHQVCFCLKTIFCNQYQFHLSLQFHVMLKKLCEYKKSIRGLGLPIII
jgi:hypothetical protein